MFFKLMAGTYTVVYVRVGVGQAITTLASPSASHGQWNCFAYESKSCSYYFRDHASMGWDGFRTQRHVTGVSRPGAIFNYKNTTGQPV